MPHVVMCDACGFVLAQTRKPGEILAPVEIVGKHGGVCRMCGRTLTVEDPILEVQKI